MDRREAFFEEFEDVITRWGSYARVPIDGQHEALRREKWEDAKIATDAFTAKWAPPGDRQEVLENQEA